VEVLTSSIADMKPGKSGLRKKVEVWQGKDDNTNKYCMQDFIQSLLDTAKASISGNVPKTLIVA
jgi:phosphoglucomutase